MSKSYIQRTRGHRRAVGAQRLHGVRPHPAPPRVQGRSIARAHQHTSTPSPLAAASSRPLCSTAEFRGRESAAATGVDPQDGDRGDRSPSAAASSGPLYSTHAHAPAHAHTHTNAHTHTYAHTRTRTHAGTHTSARAHITWVDTGGHDGGHAGTISSLGRAGPGRPPAAVYG
jgi:hypothetical protein